ncbi:MAG: radical SAM protein, partial [Oscillospiraceae bacterium]|nr:radical SAM protein [Oscillospiraceae bacterium]
MTVYFINNTYKYETEAVLKLFCPLERFTFVYDESPEKSSDIIIMEVTDKLRAYANIGGTDCEITEPLREETDKEREFRLCRMLFTALTKITGITPEWGCLTGVRPIKVVNGLISKGCDMESVCTELQEKYHANRRKSELAYLTAVTQRPALETLEPESYSLYISIPFCPSRCSYCSFVSHSIQSKSAARLIPQYVESLCREISELGEIMRDKKMFCKTVYIGGGTPTAFSAQDLKKIMETISKSIDISKICEYNVEAGRPDTITEEKLRVIKGCGATRISVNPQTMNDKVLEAAGRRHTAAQVV